MNPWMLMSVSLLSLSLSVGQPLVSWAADPVSPPLEEHLRAVNGAARTPEGEQRVVDHLSSTFNVPAGTLRAQRQQVPSWGDLSVAYWYSQKTGLPVAQILVERRSGKTWRAIAKEYNVDLNGVARDARNSTRALELGERRTDTPETRPRPREARPGERH